MKFIVLAKIMLFAEYCVYYKRTIQETTIDIRYSCQDSPRKLNDFLERVKIGVMFLLGGIVFKWYISIVLKCT